MKKTTTITILFLFLMTLGFSPLYAHQTGGNNPGMMNQSPGSMMSPPRFQMFPAQMQKLQAAMNKMRATRERLFNAKTSAERQTLMQEHLKDMETCLSLMSPGVGMEGKAGATSMQLPQKRMMNGQARGMMSHTQPQGNGNGNRPMGNQKMMTRPGMMMNGNMCGSTMVEMMKSMIIQMQMMMQSQQKKRVNARPGPDSSVSASSLCKRSFQ